jgi:hypothetical protein
VKSFTAQKKAIGVRRIATGLLWWVLLMSFWVILDDSFAADELLAGAGAAAIGAFLAELAAYQGASQVRLRVEWFLPALRLPWMLIRDTGVVGLVLLRRLTRGELPPSGFRERPVTYGRRSLLIGGLSVAPNSFVLGLDKETNVMVVHELVTGDREAGD